MALKSITLLLLRRQILLKPNLHNPIFNQTLKPYSTAQPNSPLLPNPEAKTIKPTSLSPRLSHVFNQIDAIERERQHKDSILQPIRNRREEEQRALSRPFQPAQTEAVPELRKRDGVKGVGEVKEVELVHPWKEWIELMERLVKQGYFDPEEVDGIENEVVVEEGVDLTKDFKRVERAFVSFGRDRFDILRSLSRNDIQVLVGFGCPSTEPRVVFPSKVLRKYVHLDEGDVCSSCSLRSSCERGYLLTNREEEARTADLMRVLVTYGFDPVNGPMENKSLFKNKSVRTVVHNLLHQVVKLSSVPIDPSLPPPVIKKPTPKVKQPPPPPKKRVGRTDVEMKRGDWLCPECDFMNFSKNTACMKCDSRRPKRQLLPGEWECPECNFLNYRRNVACFRCECKRPSETQMQEMQQSLTTRFERVRGNRENISNAWNLNFDDDESDGADVGPFEYADSASMGQKNSKDVRAQTGYIRDFKDDFSDRSGNSNKRRRVTSDSEKEKPSEEYDDFDDDDDDIDDYEIDTNPTVVRKPFPIYDSDGGCSDSEDLEPVRSRQGDSFSRNVPRRIREDAQSESHVDHDFGFDEDSMMHPNLAPSPTANFGLKSERRQNNPSKGLIFSSDEDFDSGSEDDFDPMRLRDDKLGSESRGFSTGGTSGSEDEYDSKLGDEGPLSRGYNGSQNNSGHGRFHPRNDFRDKGSSYGGGEISLHGNGDFESFDAFSRSSRSSHGSYRERGVRNNIASKVDGRRGFEEQLYRREKEKFSAATGFDDDGSDSDNFSAISRREGSNNNGGRSGGRSNYGGGAQRDRFNGERRREGLDDDNLFGMAPRVTLDNNKGRGGGRRGNYGGGAQRDGFDKKFSFERCDDDEYYEKAGRERFNNNRGCGGGRSNGYGSSAQRGRFDNEFSRKGSYDNGYGRTRKEVLFNCRIHKGGRSGGY